MADAHPLLIQAQEWFGLENREDWQVVDSRGKSAYLAGHIPGAIHLPAGFLIDVESERGAYKSFAELTSALGKLGLSPDKPTLLYDDSGLVPSAKLFWVMDVLGFQALTLLDGGYPAWAEADLPLEVEENKYSPIKLELHPDHSKVIGLEELLEAVDPDHSHQPKLLDARSPLEFQGLSPTAKKDGHIPGAVNLDWENHIQDLFHPFFKEKSVLAALLAERGISPDQDVVVYCRSGSRSCHSYFVLKYLGYPRVKNYPGSWLEWGNHPDTPVASQETAIHEAADQSV
jgi:thiosulfate/3-mercaptopyruvate sulfurtransferase